MDPMYGQRNLKDGSINGTRYSYNDTKHAASLVYADDNNQTKTILAFNSKKVEKVVTLVIILLQIFMLIHRNDGILTKKIV